MINVYGGIFMYKILLCCASGLTTSMLVNAMKKDAKEKNIDVMIWAVAESAIDLSWADADCILVAPQNAGDLERLKVSLIVLFRLLQLMVLTFLKWMGKLF